MNYKYRITLSGIKGFYRLYVVNGDSTLYTFHKQLRADLEFPMDQQILFKALDAAGNTIAKYALIDLGQGAVDDVRIADTIKAGAVSFIYYYDISSRKSVTITLEGEDAGSRPCSFPMILESKGPNPIEFENGYVAFEDLPPEQKHLPGEREEDDDEDDEDLEDDGEESSDEDEELLYDNEEF
ncbi:MAG: hypothetical protein J5764_00030 [Bacteroidales bacterium]|nr:hypothetical protein [Bacteroidales bacterium]